VSAQPPESDPGDPGHLDDRDLLAAHVQGDREAFGILFARHRDRLWAVALRTTGNPEDAADALQDAMISAFRRAETFRGEAQVTTWLHRIVVNACLDRIRRAKVRAVQALPDDLEEYAARGDVLAADQAGSQAGNPEAAAEHSDLRSQVLAALEELPPDQRAALVLVDMQGYPVEEAARILECPTGTVKSRCSRGRSRLAGILGHLAPNVGTDPAEAPAAAPRPRAGHTPASGTDPPAAPSKTTADTPLATGPRRTGTEPAPRGGDAT
jgi:RNA polymerase sigma-70 factor (ECF subfamily)